MDAGVRLAYCSKVQEALEAAAEKCLRVEEVGERFDGWAIAALKKRDRYN
jgi:hypothetical protein